MTGKYVIDKNTRFDHDKIDVSNGYFHITNKAKLELDHCKVEGILSPKYLNLIYLEDGRLILKNNKFKISSIDILPNPTQISFSNLIRVTQGHVKISNNAFVIDQPYIAGLFITDGLTTANFCITRNYIRNFHGGFLLINSHHALLAYNKFIRVGWSNILIMNATNILLKSNEIYFSGYNIVGDAVDIFDSVNVILDHNFILSGYCYSVLIMRGTNITLDSNQIVGGITYGIRIADAMHLSKYWPLTSFINSRARQGDDINRNIHIVHNYLAQNRYGLSASNVDGLLVQGNYFIQKFNNDTDRKFWTNNDVLLTNVSNKLWVKNLYKEAYTQNNVDDNEKSTKFVEFPASGGVSF